MKTALAALTLALSAAPALAIEPPAQMLTGTEAQAGLLTVHVNRRQGRILVELPAPDRDGVSGRFIYLTALETGLGSGTIVLDRGTTSESRLLVFRRIGRRVVAEVENPRFRAASGTPIEEEGVRHSLATSTLWVGDVAAELPDGGFLIDISGFLARDDLHIPQILHEAHAGEFHFAPDLSVADSNFVRVFPRNAEFAARITFVSDAPEAEVDNLAPQHGNLSFTLRHTLVALPERGYQPRRFDPRAGTFGTQVVDYSQPLGQPVVYELANRFRLERVDPTAPRSRVRNPIVFYIDRAAPEPIRTALREGVAWWRDAFDAAGLIDAFRVDDLPEGVDPLDIRYNVVNWVNRATRGWSYGQAISDPRTGEIIAGRVVLGSLRTRQDMIIYDALVGAARNGSGGPNDPVQVALARLRQLGAHEVGHALGFAHNFAGSTQGRTTVMDYPAPRIGLIDGAPDLSDAYGVGVGRWDRFLVDWLYGARTDADAQPRMEAMLRSGLRFVADQHSRPPDAPHPLGSLWDDSADPVAELDRMMSVRAAAVARFGPGAIPVGAPAADLRRAFVPIWLLQRYQVEAAAKGIGGVDFSYSVNGDGREAAAPVSPAEQRRALDALLATLRPAALTVPANVVPLLSAGWSGGPDRQNDIEVFRPAGGPVFDPLRASEVAAQVTLGNLLQPDRLNRLEIQHQGNPQSPGPDELFDRLLASVLPRAAISGAVEQRIATAAILDLARAEREPTLSPVIAVALSGRLARIAALLDHGNDWARGLARLLGDRAALEHVLADPARVTTIPPGMPIGEDEE